MATKLEKDLVRESLVKIDDREVIVTLTKDQTISMKLKGLRGKALSIGIEQLHNQLSGKGNEPKKEEKGSLTVIKRERNSKKDDSKMISLGDLRSHNLISTMDFETQMKFEQIIVSVINANKK